MDCVGCITQLPCDVSGESSFVSEVEVDCRLMADIPITVPVSGASRCKGPDGELGFGEEMLYDVGVEVGAWDGTGEDGSG